MEKDEWKNLGLANFADSGTHVVRTESKDNRAPLATSQVETDKKL